MCLQPERRRLHQRSESAFVTARARCHTCNLDRSKLQSVLYQATAWSKKTFRAVAAVATDEHAVDASPVYEKATGCRVGRERSFDLDFELLK